MPKPKKPIVVVTRKLPDPVELRMRELFDARLNPVDKPMSAAQLAEVERIDAISASSRPSSRRMASLCCPTAGTASIR